MQFTHRRVLEADGGGAGREPGQMAGLQLQRPVGQRHRLGLGTVQPFVQGGGQLSSAQPAHIPLEHQAPEAVAHLFPSSPNILLVRTSSKSAVSSQTRLF